jgi:hypothetical protein
MIEGNSIPRKSPHEGVPVAVRSAGSWASSWSKNPGPLGGSPLGGVEEVSLLEELASVGPSPFHERRIGRS